MKLYDSKSGTKKVVQANDEKILKFYACGPTVYSYAHIGNFRSFLTADLIVRLAKASGLTVKYVSNITDVGHLTNDDIADAQGQDKMIKALESSESKFANIWDLARFYTEAVLVDWKQLNLLEPDVRPRASEEVAEQIDMIHQLVDLGIAYETSKGVYFEVEKFPKYGELSKNKLSELRSGVRDITYDEEKRNSFDFALWKKDDSHLMKWHTRFGWGYPGWHIECSAMALKYLGSSLDIHSGGKDNLFPHHECEIAQTESITNQTFSKHWVHTAHLLVNGTPMSKSKGNFLIVQDLLNDGVSPMALRYALTCAKYRESLNFTNDSLLSSEKVITRIQNCYQSIKHDVIHDSTINTSMPQALEENYIAVYEAMADDLNTPEAYAKLLSGIKWINSRQSTLTQNDKNGCLSWFKQIDNLLGILDLDHQVETNGRNNQTIKWIETLISKREQARKENNYALADEIRDQLLQSGITLKDTAEGVEWTEHKKEGKFL
ncbi:cysteine--tRNA ligase [Cysteiniphilum halobium]|uniref:cysteine--tRNA ligase n=1 Tax=Cysteiniphilum halobium TaxID=2219059 RepID=UPI003F8708E3